MGSKKLRMSLLGYIMIVHHLSPGICIAEQSSSLTLCGETRIESPFSGNSDSPLLNRMVLCKSQKPYFRTSIGLFPISSINYTRKLLTVSNYPSSSMSNYVSPSLLVAGFRPPPEPNSLLVFNCPSELVLHATANVTLYQNGTHLAVDHLEELEASGSFKPEDMNCSVYYWAHKKNSYGGEGSVKYEVGARVSFDVPGHVPNMCDQCRKPDGHCGVGLKCICHPQECRDQIGARSGSLNRFDIIFWPIFASTILVMVTLPRTERELLVVLCFGH